jgi:hypothetical protein
MSTAGITLTVTEVLVGRPRISGARNAGLDEVGAERGWFPFLGFLVLVGVDGNDEGGRMKADVGDKLEVDVSAAGVDVSVAAAGVHAARRRVRIIRCRISRFIVNSWWDTPVPLSFEGGTGGRRGFI